MSAADLRSPSVSVETTRLHKDTRRYVPVEPTIRLRLFTAAGSERGCDLTEDDALALAQQLLSSVRHLRDLT